MTNSIFYSKARRARRPVTTASRGGADARAEVKSEMKRAVVIQFLSLKIPRTLIFGPFPARPGRPGRVFGGKDVARCRLAVQQRPLT